MTNTATSTARLAGAGMTFLLIVLAGCGTDDQDAPGQGAAGVDSLPSATPSPSTPSGGPVSDPAPTSAAVETLTSLTETFDDDANDWALPPSEQGSADVEGGDFVWESKEPGLRPHITAGTMVDADEAGHLDLADVRVEASVTPERGRAAMAVYCREVPDPDGDYQWYEFVVRDGYSAIRHADLAGHLDVLAKGTRADVPLGRPATIQGTCVDDQDGRAVLTLVLNGAELLTTTVADPLENGVAGLQAYDATEEESTDRFLLAWHDFSVRPVTG